MVGDERNVDYRASHLNKGADYDACLESAPFDRYMARHEAAIVRTLVNDLFPDGIPRYLDFACGTGRITAQVEPAARKSWAVDVSEAMVARARPRCPATTFVIADVTKAPLDVGPVDLITAFRFFANAQNELREQALDALAAMMRPGGYLLLNNHRNSWSVRNLLLRASGQPHAGRLSPIEMKRLLERHGFEVVRSIGVGLFVFRARLVRTDVLESRWFAALEPWSRHGPLSLVCPDVLVLARRVR